MKAIEFVGACLLFAKEEDPKWLPREGWDVTLLAALSDPNSPLYWPKLNASYVSRPYGHYVTHGSGTHGGVHSSRWGVKSVVPGTRDIPGQRNLPRWLKGFEFKGASDVWIAEIPATPPQNDITYWWRSEPPETDEPDSDTTWELDPDEFFEPRSGKKAREKGETIKTLRPR